MNWKIGKCRAWNPLCFGQCWCPACRQTDGNQSSLNKSSLQVHWVFLKVEKALSEVVMTFFQTVGGGAGQDRAPEMDGGGPAEQDRNHSNSSTLSDRRLSNSSLCSIEEEHRTVYEMVQRILLSTRGYVNFVNEVFCQVSVRACVCGISS